MGATGATGATGPTGATGATGATGEAQPQALNAYSIPSAPVTDGSAVVLDRNSLQQGTDISHAANSSDVVISSPGTYYAHYSATVSPVSTSSFPVTNLGTIALNGQAQNGGSGQLLFNSAGSSGQISASLVFTVTQVPTTLTVVSSGGNFIYSGASLNVFKV